MKPKMKPCPFCGGEAEHESTVLDDVVRCTKCWATIKTKGSKIVAKNMWNRRAAPIVKPDKLPRGEIHQGPQRSAPAVKARVPTKVGWWWRKTMIGNWYPVKVSETNDGLVWAGVLQTVNNDGLWGGPCEMPKEGGGE